jgi:ribonucleoside-diphosphate reductase alpha chain
MEKIVASGSLAHIDEIPEDIKNVFVCAHDISPEWHIRMQAAFQKHVDNAVSKTVNFPSAATKEDVSEVFMLAYKLDCKGVTIYRDGSRDSQVLSIGGAAKEAPAEASPAPVFDTISPRPRPDVTTGFTEKIKVGCGNLYITVNYDENGLCEVFTNTGRHGGCPSQSEATSRLVSIALRSGMEVDSIVEQLRGIRCASTIRQPGMKVLSCPDAIARVIAKVKNHHAENGKGLETHEDRDVPAPEENAASADARPCPECSHPLESDGGCIICRNCGYSKCN